MEYLCHRRCFQISSSAGIISHFVNLQIVVPVATIQGPGSGDYHVDVGSVIDLVCIIDKVKSIDLDDWEL